MSKHRFFTPLSLVIAAVSLAPVHAQNGSEPDPVYETTKSNAQMASARAEAKARIEEWLAVAADPNQRNGYLEFKFPLEGYEHIWVQFVRRDGDFLEGTLSNSPHSPNYSLGDSVRVQISEVTDWGYIDSDGVMQGHFTTRALFDRMPEGQVAQIKAIFGWD